MTLNDPRRHYSFQSTLLCTGTHDNGCWCLHPRFCGLCSSDVRGICILCLDFRTAFDKVSHDYLYNILSENGFDDTSVGIPHVLHKNASFSYDVNGVPIGALFDWMFGTIGMPVKRDNSIVLYIYSTQPLVDSLAETLEGLQITPTSSEVSVFVYADIMIILTSRQWQTHYTNVMQMPALNLPNHKPCHWADGTLELISWHSLRL